MIKLMKLETAIEYAKQFIGLPYIWGGDDPLTGFDCSGLVQEILASVGLDPEGDQTAQGLYDYFVKRPNTKTAQGPGALVFFGQSITKITHIGFMINDFQMIEAGGGGSKTLSLKDAATQNAFVKIRPASRRKDLVAVLLPSYD
jgi:cell wall-associated NlpC family hydrolase